MIQIFKFSLIFDNFLVANFLFPSLQSVLHLGFSKFEFYWANLFIECADFLTQGGKFPPLVFKSIGKSSAQLCSVHLFYCFTGLSNLVY